MPISTVHEAPRRTAEGGRRKKLFNKPLTRYEIVRTFAAPKHKKTMAVSAKMIEEARKRGIVEGAMVRSAKNPALTPQAVVSPDQWWETDFGNINNGIGYYLFYGGKWSEVVSPSPNKGLKDRDAVECGPAMRAAITELAEELGFDISSSATCSIRNDRCRGVWFHRDKNCIGGHISISDLSYMTPEEFIAKMRVTASSPKPIKIGGRVVEFQSNGSVTVGCTDVDFGTLEAVYNKAKAMRS